MECGAVEGPRGHAFPSQISYDPGLAGEVPHVDDQGVPFPAADRVAHPQLDVRSGMRAAVQADHAVEMIVLVQNHHLARRLLNLPAVVIAEERATRRARRQATDPVIVDGPRFERVIADVVLFRDRPRLPWDPTVWRIDHGDVSGWMRTIGRTPRAAVGPVEPLVPV